ncbi:hypothetical protein [Lysinibacter sp. HNR]|nr:hypothetical protein [Lysinibacter sp. HNR]WGD37941.1 hypothetical protein FrondiHNR_03225 [Lysinibacter sp. HNR]
MRVLIIKDAVYRAKAVRAGLRLEVMPVDGAAVGAEYAVVTDRD